MCTLLYIVAYLSQSLFLQYYHILSQGICVSFTLLLGWSWHTVIGYCNIYFIDFNSNNKRPCGSANLGP